MSIRSFWTIFIKIVGIWLVFSSLTVVPQGIFTLLTSYFPDSREGLLMLLVPVVLLTVGIYIYILTIFVFKTSWFIDKLKLDKGFADERLDLNIHRSTVLSVAVIVIGGVLFLDSLPLFLRLFFKEIQQHNITGEQFESEWVIFYFVKTMLGYIVMIKNKEIVRRIDKEVPPITSTDDGASGDSVELSDKSDD